MPRPSLVASSGPSPVRGFIAAIECSLRTFRPASAGPSRPRVSTLRRTRTAPGTELHLNFLHCSLSAAVVVQRPCEECPLGPCEECPLAADRASQGSKDTQHEAT